MRISKFLQEYRTEDVFSALTEYFGYVIDATKEAQNCIRALQSDKSSDEINRDVLSHVNNVIEYKKEADVLIRNEVTKLSGSKFSPENRAALLELMFSGGEIIDSIETLVFTLKMGMMADINYKDVKSTVISGMIRMFEKLEREMVYIKDAVTRFMDEPDDASGKCNLASDMEKEVDMVYSYTMTELLKSSKNSNPSRFYLFKEMINYIEITSNRIEDVGNKIRILIAEYS